jgi:phage gp46-like protein
MLPYVRPFSRALAFAQIWTLEATRWLVAEKRVVSIDAKASAGTRGPSWIDIELDVRPTLETRKRFRTEALYGT